MSMKSILSLMTVALFSAWLVACGGGSVSGSGGGGGSSSNLVVKLDQSVNSAMFQTSPEYGSRMVATISDLLIRTAEAQVGGTIVYIVDPDGTVVASGPVNDAGEAFFDVPANDPGETYSVCLDPLDPLTCVTLSFPVTETDGVQVTVGQDATTGALFIVSEGLGTQVEPTADNLDAFQDPKLAHKVIICHNANKNNPHTISIAKEAWPDHEAHGDTLGACPVAPTDTSTSGVEEEPDDGPGNSGNKGNKGNKGGKKS